MSIRAILIGTPNTGKTSLFNYLTDSQNLVGNWDGVTVDSAVGDFKYLDTNIQVIDLPGCYSLVFNNYMADDEKLVCQYLHDLTIKKSIEDLVYINVINSDNLARDLYLSLQLLEQNYNLLMVINIKDNDKKKYHNLALQLNKLFKKTVVCCNANNGYGIAQLKASIYQQTNNNNNIMIYDQYIPKKFLTIFDQYILNNNINMGLLIKYLENDLLSRQLLSNNIDIINNNFNNIKWDIFFATRRHKFISNFINTNIVNKISNINAVLDKIFLHKYVGLPIFILIMYSMFFGMIKLIGISQYYFDIFFNILIKPIFSGLMNYQAPLWLLSIIKDGLVVGLITMLNFIPVLFIVHIGLFILENSGYIARVMVLMDKLMGFLGLSGKSLIPMIVGFSCNVPAIVSSRTIEQKRDKIITILMTPFMSCNARLAVYSIFVTAFFSSNSANIMFYLYIIGIIAAVATGFLLQKILPGSRNNLLLNLPNYKLPAISIILKKSATRVINFLKDASLSVIGVCVVVSGLKFFNLLNYNWFKYITIIFKPMGITDNNWPALASLLSGIVAKETIIGSLNSFYHTEGVELYGALQANFGSKEAAFAYLLFVLLCFPCVSVVVSIAKELNIRWAIFSAIWTTGIAYLVAVSYYQLTTLSYSSSYDVLLLLIKILLLLASSVILLKIFFNNYLKKTDRSIDIMVEQ